jgi:hypothetical protein
VRVTELNIVVTDVHLPGADDDPAAAGPTPPPSAPAATL